MSFWAERAAVFAVRAISAFFRCLGWRACRFEPSCSVYAEQAFGRFGFFTAFRLSVQRVLKCHPFHAGGHDPLPAITSGDTHLSKGGCPPLLGDLWKNVL